MKEELFFKASYLPKVLDKDETIKLFKEMKNGSIEARNKLIEHNIRLVLYQVTSKFCNVNCDKDELVSVGNIALIKAIDTFDIDSGNTFATYAVKCINNGILMYLRKIKKHMNVDSLDKIVFHKEGSNVITVGDTIQHDVDITENYEMVESREIVKNIIKTLNDREREIVMLYFGFYDGKIYTQKEISKKVNLSQAQVCRCIDQILKKLENKLEYMSLRDAELLNNKDINYTIYDFFNKYNKEYVDVMLNKLNHMDIELLYKIFGDDLENPKRNILSDKEERMFCKILIPKMKSLLHDILKEAKIEDKKLESSYKDKITYIKIKNIISSNNIKIKGLTKKESIIICLILGLFDNECIDSKSIANFLEIPEKEVIDIAKKALLKLKNNFNNNMDNIINLIVNEESNIINYTKKLSN